MSKRCYGTNVRCKTSFIRQDRQDLPTLSPMLSLLFYSGLAIFSFSNNLEKYLR